MERILSQCRIRGNKKIEYSQNVQYKRNNIFDTSAFPFAGIDDIVTERGGIAHKLYGTTYIKEVTLIEYCDTICNAVKEIDIILYDELPKIIRKRPWNNTY